MRHGSGLRKLNRTSEHRQAMLRNMRVLNVPKRGIGDASVAKLFTDLGPRFKARPGGYTRILKMGFRVGDNAPMAFVELVDRPAADDGQSGQE